MTALPISWVELSGGVWSMDVGGGTDITGPPETMGPLYGVSVRPCCEFSGRSPPESAHSWSGGPMVTPPPPSYPE